MEDFDRRALLAAAGIVGVGGLAALTARAGPINPPSGAVGPTGRTSDEIYNKISGAPSEGRTLLNVGNSASGGTIQITTPGSYVLAANHNALGIAIIIASSNVTLDLNGFTVTGEPGSFAISASGAASIANIMIRNGTIVNGSRGIGGSIPCTSVRIEDVVMIGQRAMGIDLSSTSNRHISVSRCRVLDLGLASVSTDVIGTLNGINIAGSGAVVEDCRVERIVYNGTNTPLIHAINCPSVAGQFIARNSIANDTSLSPSTAFGIVATGTGVYRDNSVGSFGTPYSVSGLINGGGNV